MTPALAGPLDDAPQVGHEVARSMLDDALDDLTMGAWDTQVRSWVDFADPAYGATVASWLRRSWDAGVAAGRRECSDEVSGYHAAVQRLRATLDDITGRRA